MDKVWNRTIFWLAMFVWLAIVLSSFLISILLQIPWWACLAINAVVLLTVFNRAKKCFRSVGSSENPGYFIMSRFGKSLRVLDPGLAFLLDPIEGGKFVSSREKTLHYLFTADHGIRTADHQLIEKLNVGFDFHFPDPSLDYVFPVSRNCEIGEVVIDVGLKGLSDGLEWKRVSGEDLLINFTYYKFPFKMLENNDVVGIGRFFEKPILAAITHAIGKCRSYELSGKQQEIEDLAKHQLVCDLGNVVLALGIPLECIALNFSAQFHEDTNTAWRQKEIVEKDKEVAPIRANTAAEVRKIGAAAAKAAAPDEADALKTKMQTLIDLGTDKTVAAMLVAGGLSGKGDQGEQGDVIGSLAKLGVARLTMNLADKEDKKGGP